MRQLTNSEIDKFAARTGVKKIAVENFLDTLYEPAELRGNMANLYADAASYKWNVATVTAIREGINKAYR